MNDTRTEKALHLTNISRGNKAFLIAGLMCELQSVLFEDALVKGRHQPTSYPFMHAGYPCCMTVDTVDLRHLSDEAFQADLRGAINRTIELIPGKVTGALKDMLSFGFGPFRFAAKITGYRVSPDGPWVEEPDDLPRGIPLGRRIEFKASPVRSLAV